MKMLKKMAALLLAGVMALALLTACGDEAPANPVTAAKKVEDGYLAIVNQSSDVKYENDAELQKAARNALKSIDNDGKVEKAYGLIGEPTEDGYSAYMISVDTSGTVNGKYTAIALTADAVDQISSPEVTKALTQYYKALFASLNNSGCTVSKIAIGAETRGEKTYVAFAVTVTRNK